MVEIPVRGGVVHLRASAPGRATVKLGPVGQAATTAITAVFTVESGSVAMGPVGDERVASSPTHLLMAD